jgi:translation initiation factor IF-2
MRTTSFNEDQRQQPPRASTPTVLRRNLDQDELDRLLGSVSNAPRYNVSKVPQRDTTSSFASLSREPRAQLECTRCGSKDHSSFGCPNRKTVTWKPRASPSLDQDQRAPRTQESLADAANAWAQRKNNKFDELEMSPQFMQEEEQRTQRAAEISERRRNRFRMEEEGAAPMQTHNRYEEPARRKKGGNERRTRNRVMYDEDFENEDRYVSKEERKRQRKEAKKAAHMAKEEPTPVVLPEYVSVANLASILRLRVEDFIQKLEELGFEEVQNDHILNSEHAGLIAQEYNFEPVFQTEADDRDLYPAPELSPEDYAQLPTRPPVVTIMGHVDHGKTTILDYIRSTQVAAGEFGGITQHIGAFSVPLASGKKITFLDTPGHAAFETMRARGANVTDIVVLVVAADDSVMPQTVEAIKHAQAAKVPIIVAINKIDKQHADLDRVKLDLGRHGLEVEDYGGDVQTVNVSGKTGQGISDLEEAISLQSEVLDHRADPHTQVEGWVLEGTTKKNGRVATVLVRSGTLRPGDVLVAGTTWTRVRTLRNELGVAISEVGPGMPVEVDGWREQPIAGDEVLQAEDEQQGAEVAKLRMDKVERERLAKDMEAVNESRRHETERREAEEAAAKAAANGEAKIEAKAQESGPALVSFIIKGDVSGSVEAVIDSVTSLGNNEVATRILRYGVGPPSEFDVEHAAAANGHIINFNTVLAPNITSLAELKGVRILDSNIIYRVVENVKAVLEEKLPPKITQRVTGEAEVAAVFEISLGGKKKLKIAGSKVRNGMVERNTKVKVLRGDAVIFDGMYIFIYVPCLFFLGWENGS